MKKHLSLLLLFLPVVLYCCATTFSQQQQPPANDVEQITNIYVVTPRTGSQHFDLSENWQLGWRDDSNKNLTDLETVKDWINVERPTSVPVALFKAGKLPDPYKNLNIKQHKWAEQKVWYYKKAFTVSKLEKEGFAFLSFDGLDYYSRVWLNGKALGKHEGMFGGPEFEVSQILNFDKPNELVVTIASANYGNSDYSPRNPGRFIKPWATSGGSGVEPFFTFGMWRGVRLDFVSKTHLERPFIRTEKISDDHSEAILIVETEIFSGKHSLQYKLHAWENRQLIDFSNPNSVQKSSETKKELKVRLVHKNQRQEEVFSVQIPEGRSWHKHRITVKNPALWFPNGLGEPNLYRCELELLENGQPVDKIATNIGVRTINWIESAGKRISDRWGNWQCVVNGSPIFVKGVNWMPADTLLELPREKFRWRLQLAKNAGIQMIRIWGPGHQESEDFYDFCDEFGIMVWQDFPMGNFDTPNWLQDIWEEQVMHTIFRLRNRTSLAVWCGGNEFNPYSKGNAASVGIIERNLRLFDETRKFLRTTPDEGSFHAYPDMCPSWYKKRFSAYPYVAETGIHSMASPYWLREYIDPKELPTTYKMWDKEFKNTNPETALHFVEYSPGRVPRMLSRASHIVDMTSPSIEDLTLATQLGAEEFYQVLSEGMQANYPVTTGLMPWVFARSWPVIAGIQLVDGSDQPLAPYYALKRTYEPQHVLLDIDRLLWKSGEQFIVRVKTLNASQQKRFNGNISVQIFDDSYEILYDKKLPINVSNGVAVNQVDFEPFAIPNDYKSRYFYVVTELFDTNGKSVSRSVYRPRTIEAMENPEYYKKFVSAPIAWATLTKGPWLKETIQKSPKTTLKIEKTKPKPVNSRDFEQILTISNTGNVPCPLVILDIASADVVVDCNDNYFWLASGETKTITTTIHARDGKEPKALEVNVRSWNAE
jgi:beta-mannosidase